MRNRMIGESMRKTRSWIAGFFAFFAAVHFIAPAFAAPTLLDFEDIASGTTVTAQYGPRGVVFSNHFLGTDPAAHSGTQVLRTIAPQSEVFTPVPLVMTFTSAQARVKLFAGAPGSAINGTLTAFDAGGNVVAQDGPKLVAADVFTTMFEVTVTTASITRAELRLGDFAYYAIDDLEFEGEPAAEAPPPPQVSIMSPPDGAQLDVEAIAIEGTIAGEGVLSASATVEFGRPPSQASAPVFKTALVLSGSGQTRQFNLPGGFNGVPFGPVKVTVEAENFAGGKGADSATFVNLPQAIRDRAALLGASALGAFRFGVRTTACRIAVYENAAISADAAAGATFVIRGDILPKWIAEQSRMGCPTGEEEPRKQFSFEGHDWCYLVDGEHPCVNPDIAGVVQNFAGGRIHSTAGIGTFYVPAVFCDIIEKRGGAAATGVPMADPTSSAGPMQTWLFQRFATPELPLRLPSTIEIRGGAPRIYIERQAGHLLDQNSRNATPTTATIWEHFPCSGYQGPCDVAPTPPQPAPIENPGDKFCQGTTFPFGPTEWEPILGNWVSTPLFGVVNMSKMATIDLGLNHEWCYQDGLEWKDLAGVGGGFLLGGAAGAVGGFVAVRDMTCPSDWLLRVEPYGAHAGTGPHGTLYAGTSKTSVKVEYERFYGDMVVWMGGPVVGDLMFLAGRWIIDCGHDSYKSELHPISMFSKMKTVTTLTEPFTGIVDPNPFGGTPDNPVPGTQADIWVTGWYPGDPVAFEIHPPPRPSPDAVLTVNKPVDSQAIVGVNMTWSAVNGIVGLRFNAPLRKNTVTEYGEMVWESGRGYEGQWYVHWSE